MELFYIAKRCTYTRKEISIDYFSATPRSLIGDKKDKKEGYIYLRYTGVVNGKLLDSKYQWHNLTEYSGIFRGKDKIYTNGGSEIYNKV